MNICEVQTNHFSISFNDFYIIVVEFAAFAIVFDAIFAVVVFDIGVVIGAVAVHFEFSLFSAGNQFVKDVAAVDIVVVFTDVAIIVFYIGASVVAFDIAVVVVAAVAVVAAVVVVVADDVDAVIVSTIAVVVVTAVVVIFVTVYVDPVIVYTIAVVVNTDVDEFIVKICHFDALIIFFIFIKYFIFIIIIIHWNIFLKILNFFTNILI